MESGSRTMRSLILFCGTRGARGQGKSRLCGRLRFSSSPPSRNPRAPWIPASAGTPNRRHMFSIITLPKPEQLTWVAPSIRRAKS
jgi:hypothetical protein